MKLNRLINLPLAFVTLAGCMAALPAAGQDKWGYKKKDGSWTYVDKMEYKRASDSYGVQKGMTQYDVARSEVVELSVPRPADFDKYATQLSQPIPDPTSIPGMESIVQKYMCMKWDEEGLLCLIPAYQRKNDDRKIVDSCNSLKLVRGAVPEALLSAYWGAMSRMGQANTLKGEIAKAIESGSRLAAAAAYVVRGDILVQEGKKEDALIDGYLRVVILYNDIKSIQPEALYKTWQTMSSRGDKRSERFKTELLDKYPDSQQAKTLKP